MHRKLLALPLRKQTNRKRKEMKGKIVWEGGGGESKEEERTRTAEMQDGKGVRKQAKGRVAQSSVCLSHLQRFSMLQQHCRFVLHLKQQQQ